MIVTKEQIQRLKPYIPEIEALVEAGDVQEVLDAVDNVVIDNILAHDNEPDEEGLAIETIRDAIFYQNQDED
ncbi:hypothetical protein [Stomatobaculum longum]|jgi:hypothetical protein|uniref:hypothetical protein n=1 Tax=Stomatobaculum longum TaxID=796942 RepID=UPI0028DB0515|nr:hypothetical protein [Stomatobaculum longum]